MVEGNRQDPAESSAEASAVLEGCKDGNTSGTKKSSGVLGWKSRCREMQGLHRRRKDGKKSVEEGRPKERLNYSEEIAQNPEFERYYRDQRICPDEQWDEFITCCRSNLPISFRFNTCIPLWRMTIERLAKAGSQHPELGLTAAIKHERPYLRLDTGTSLYYQLTPHKSALRKDPKVVEFRKCLIDEDNRGAVTRQEIVSMLPVIYLDPQPHENIIDLCAAPGMKYIQILEAVHSSLMYRHRQAPCENMGVIIGNDVCQSRVSTLSHRVKAMNCPSAAVTNYDASRFPTIFNSSGKRILFDRVLADVPCSCDGTTRKAPDIWNKWKTTGGLHMHKLQLSIVKRALQLLKVGGTMVYSTCSLNPLENEAIASYIVSEGYREHGVVIQPLDRLEGFKTSPGLTQWLVPNPDGGYFESFDQVPLAVRDRVTPSMFKAPEWDDSQAQNVIRVLPHDNDTGAFFLFKVKKVVSHEAEEPQQEIKQIDIVLADPDYKKISLKRGSKLLHDYVLYKDTNPEEFDVLCRFYGIEGPKRDVFACVLATKRHCRTSCYLIAGENTTSLFQKRKGQKPPRTGATNKAAPAVAGLEMPPRDEGVLEAELDQPACERRRHDVEADQSGQKKWERCKYALLGMRAFTKLESKATLGSPCEMRISQESTLLLLGMIQRRVMFANMAFCADLVKGNMQAPQLQEHERLGNISSLDLCRREGALESGGCIVIIVPQWAHARIPRAVLSADHANGITIDAEHLGDEATGITPVPDLLDTMSLACVLSDTGSLFPYASPHIMHLLHTLVDMYK